MRGVSEDVVKGVATHPFTMNAYAYCWNRPLDLVDLDGREPEPSPSTAGYSCPWDHGPNCSVFGVRMCERPTSYIFYIPGSRASQNRVPLNLLRWIGEASYRVGGPSGLTGLRTPPNRREADIYAQREWATGNFPVIVPVRSASELKAFWNEDMGTREAGIANVYFLFHGSQVACEDSSEEDRHYVGFMAFYGRGRVMANDSLLGSEDTSVTSFTSRTFNNLIFSVCNSGNSNSNFSNVADAFIQQMDITGTVSAWHGVTYFDHRGTRTLNPALHRTPDGRERIFNANTGTWEDVPR